MSVAVTNRLLLVCKACWTEHYPDDPPRVASVHSYEDCFVCQQNRGLVYVKARIEWTRNP